VFQIVPVSCVSSPHRCEVAARHELEEKEIEKLEREAGIAVQKVVPHMQSLLKYAVIVVVCMLPFA